MKITPAVGRRGRELSFGLNTNARAAGGRK